MTMYYFERLHKLNYAMSEIKGDDSFSRVDKRYIY